MVYLVSGFRWSFFGVSDVAVELSLAMTVVFLLLCLGDRCLDLPDGVPPQGVTAVAGSVGRSQ